MGVENAPQAIAHRGGLPQNHQAKYRTCHLHRGQVQYVTCPLRFICREAQVAHSDSTPHTAITPR